MSQYNIIVSTSEATVVSEYEPQLTRSDAYQSEAALEAAFIKQLTEQGYTYLQIHNSDELVENLRVQLEKLNNYHFSDDEWNRFFTQCLANGNDGIVEKTRLIQEDNVQVLKRDDGTSKNITLIDKKNIHNNSLQVINQYVENSGNYDNRYDVTVSKKGEPELSDEELDLIEDNLNDLLGLEDFSLPTLEISVGADEQDVADIFVRVNSGGQKLNENNFIQTLIAVYEKEVHDNITKFCKDSRIPKDGTSYNLIMEIDPQHLVRMAVGLGFHRARLRYAYMLLRGKSLETGKYSDEIRTQNLTIFKEALEEAMNLNNWHAFINCVSSAGYVSNKLIASSNAVVFSYVLYLIGKLEYKVDSVRLNKIIAKWFFMSAITYFYTGSTESEVEKQFADLRNIHSADEFVDYLKKTIAGRFTDDYFNFTLPNELNTSSIISPAWNGYVAAQIVLNNPMLFSTSGLAKYLLPGASGTKNAVDKHHIFPKNYLTQIGFTTDRDRNQVANFTYLDYVTNIDISDDAPALYVERYKETLGDEYKTHCENHALPENFETMEYMEFLNQRRHLMAQIVKKAFERL